MHPNGRDASSSSGGRPSKIFSLALDSLPTQSGVKQEDGQNMLSDEPSTSVSGAYDEAFCDPDTLIATIASLFPENTEVISKSLFNTLGSTRSNDGIQMELIELLGFDHFDFVAKLLENRNRINETLKQQARSSTIKRNAHIAAGNAQTTTLPAYNSSITVQTESQAELRKVLRKEERKAKKELKQVQDNLTEEEKAEFEATQRDIIRQRQLEIESLKYAPKQDSQRNVENYPYVFDASIQGRQTFLAINGVKYILPEGTVRESYKTYEEVVVPPSESKGVTDIQHVYVKDMDEIGQLGFKGIEKLNVIQSIVFEKAYKTRENLLICAPTGAGKTNIAMLAILNCVHEHTYSNGQIAKDDFKIIYIAPMKALATEMTENFGKRLEPLGLKVRELTGDTVLSRKEIEETQMLILTPEKWDVVTRKATPDTALTSLVRLLIIDEVHLLHDDRGPVIETIVARTLRQVEISQVMIRIVGLSATLPNYVDVANFLRVNPHEGLFYFDGRFRPVPLTQKFIGCRSQAGVRDMNTTMDEVCYEQVINFVKRGHQVLVFVHTRNGTARLAQAFKDMGAKLGQLEVFLPRAATDKTRAYVESQKKMNTARSKQLVEFFRLGFGIHHAGLVRHDRILMEKIFGAGHINVLFCTATLAWGVNLPAHAVVIRGTDVFDAEKGAFTDLGVLDVQQIFGRAGRPQFETEGHGIIITTASKMDKYLGMLTRQNPIESQFFKKIHDNLNAEISLGTVTNIDEAVNWLRYTYYYTRATLNPMAYGLNHVVLQKDPQLRNHLSELLTTIAADLDKNKMIRFNAPLGHVYATDLGRTASNFYVSYETVELLNDAIASAQGGLPVSLTEYMPDDMVIALISMATEFSQLKVREDECLDLEELVSAGCMLPVRGGGLASVAGKVNVLMQAYISRTFIRSFTLSSESLYVQQNAGRLCRAIFEMVLRNGWAHATISFLTMAKCIEKRLWPNQCCLRQLLEYGYVQLSWIEKIEQRKLTDTKLMDLSAKDIGYMLSCDGRKVFDAIRMIPKLEVTATIKPITYTIVQVEAQLTPIFSWNERVLGKGGAQAFWITIENIDENRIIHHERISLNKKKVVKRETQYLTFTIPVRDRELANRFQFRIASDFFLIDDTIYPLSLHNCIMPKSFKAHTDLLPLQPLPISTLKNPIFESLYSFPYFNPIQTQIFHCLYKTDESSLIGAPTGSGKTLCAELAIYRLLQDHPHMKCAYIAPLKALVRERVLDWKAKFDKIGVKVIEVSGDYTPDVETLNNSTILVTTPEKWDGITRSWSTREYVRQVGLIVLDEIHLLGVERGAVLEAIITRLKLLTKRSCFRETPVRLLGLSTALANAGDVGEWLGIKDQGLFNFRPSVRPVPIEVHIKGFPGQHYCPRMALMNKPAFKDILTYSPTKPVLVFVASRRQTRLTAMAFMSHLVAEDNPRQWLHMEMEELNVLLATVKDENLKLVLPFGIGMHHAGLSAQERAVVEQLFLEKKIQVLIATATLAWGINMPAHLVIVKGTEYYDGKTSSYVDFPVTDVLQMMGRAGRPQFDSSAVAIIYVQDIKKVFYKQFLYEPFPVESSLQPALANHVNAEICSGMIRSRQEVIEYIAGTYFYRRLFANPCYYGLYDTSDESVLAFLTQIVNEVVQELRTSNCIIFTEEPGEDENELSCSVFGRLACVYYLQHQTIRFLLAELKDNSSIEELLRIMTHVPEYSDIPVRHNEDLINTDLQKLLRIRFSTSVMDSSHTKTHLLFQAHFTRLPLQTDYRTDLKSVLDQCIRILQAMRDICMIREWFATAVNITVLQQMCYCGRWYDDHPLLSLPHLSEDEAYKLGNNISVPELQEKFGIKQENVDEKDKIIRKNLKFLLDRSMLEEDAAKEVIRALCDWPIVSVNNLKLLSTGMEQDNSRKFEAGKTYRLVLTLRMAGRRGKNSAAVLPRWSKEKPPSWVVLVGVKDTNHLLAMSQISPFTGERRVRLDVTMPQVRSRIHLNVFLMSDCYLGIDQEYQIAVDIE